MATRNTIGTYYSYGNNNEMRLIEFSRFADKAESIKVQVLDSQKNYFFTVLGENIFVERKHITKKESDISSQKEDKKLSKLSIKKQNKLIEELLKGSREINFSSIENRVSSFKVCNSKES